MAAGLGFCTALSSTRIAWLPVENTRGGIFRCRPLRNRGCVIRADVNFVNADEAKELVAVDGYTILDVRDKTQYERAHISSCHHIPVYIENTDNDPGTFLLRTVHNGFSGLFFGIPFTKPNAEFVQSVKNQFSPDRKLVVVCQEGLRLYVWRDGKVAEVQTSVTRSAAAAYKLEEAGFENISCISSGLQSVKPGTFDSVGSSELQNAGKAGLVVVQGKISAVLGTVLVILLLIITVFPDQSEKILQKFSGS